MSATRPPEEAGTAALQGEGAVVTEEATLIGSLVRFIADRVPEARDIRIDRLRRAGAGASTENWLFDAQWSTGTGDIRTALVLRRAPANEVVVATRENEFHLLRALAGTGARAPQAHWLDTEGRWLGRPAMVLGQCPGRADRHLLNARNGLGLTKEVQCHLAHELVDALCDIHRVEPTAVMAACGAALGTPSFAAQELDRCEAGLRDHQIEPEPEMQLAAWWLRDHLPPAPKRTVLVHGDFRPANVLVQDGHLTAVLDWELAHLGDPSEDLGWYLAAVYRGEHFIPGAWAPRDFIARYEANLGVSVDRRALHFWSVFALYKLATIALATTAAFVQGDAGRLAVFPRPLRVALLRSLSDEVVAEER